VTVQLRNMAVLILISVVASACQSAAAEPPKISVTVRPEPVYVEREGNNNYLVCSFELTNSSAGTQQISQMHMRAFDSQGSLLLWGKLDSNGSRRSIEVLGPRALETGKPLTVFNPFEEFETAVPVDHLVFEFDTAGSEGSGETVSVEVKPTRYQQKTELILPVSGAEVWAYEGPGFYSHHSRIDLTEPFTRDVMKLHTNSQLYALDLVVVDKEGSLARGSDSKKENWLGFDFPIVAPGSGTILHVENDQPDEMPFDEERATKNPKVFVGNYVVIDHGDGEYSALGHF
jgi:hypothetical protein